MARVTFARDYNHTWPSRAMTHFPAGWSGTVKAEVAERAKSLGALADDDKERKPAETLPGNLPADLAEPSALNPALRSGSNSE